MEFTQRNEYKGDNNKTITREMENCCKPLNKRRRYKTQFGSITN